MAILEVEVIVGSVDVAGDDAGELASVLALVRLVQDVDHPLGHGVAVVGVVRRAQVDHGLVDGVRGLVGEDAGAQARDHLLRPRHVGGVKHVVVDAHVVSLVVDEDKIMDA